MRNDNQSDVTISPAIGFTVAEGKEAYKVDATAKPSKLLINESPLQLLPTLARFIGDRHATLLQQLFYLENSLQGEIDEHGNKWVRVVIDGKERITWCKIMPYLERCTIRQILEDLESEGFIKSRNFTGRPLYYRVDIMAVDNLTEPVERICKGKKRGRVITPSIVCKLDDTSIVYKSDDNHLINRQSSSNNQTTIVYKLDTSENTKNHLESTEIQDSAEIPETPSKPKKPRTTKPPVSEEKSQAMATALNLNLKLTSSKKDITIAIRELERLYPDDATPANITRVCNHLKRPNFNPPPSFIVKQWQATIISLESQSGASCEVLSAEVLSVMASIKATCLEPLTGWDKKDNELAKLLAERVIANSWQVYVSEFGTQEKRWWGEGKPSLAVFKQGFKEFVEKQANHAPVATELKPTIKLTLQDVINATKRNN